MHARAAGIGKQVEEVFTLAHLAQHTTGDTVIQEQTGIQIVSEIHPQASVIFAHFDKVAFIAHFLVLIGPFLTLTGFEHQFVRRDAQNANGGGNNIQQTLTRFLRINRLRRGIFLHHDPVSVAIDRHVVLW
ncbi:hypothetical protein D1872_264130 [compost metagenome]